MSVRPLTAETLAEFPLPEPPPDGDKHDRGSLLVVAGGGAVPGAALLTGRAALRVGAGRVRLAAGGPASAALGLAIPEARIVTVPTTEAGDFRGRAARSLSAVAETSDAIVVGPGLIETRIAGRLTRALLGAHRTAGVVVDAAALPRGEDGPFARLAAGRAVLTPHAGEMATMMGVEKEAVTADSLEWARRAAERFQSVVVMKGATTFVAPPGGQAWRHDGGVVGLGTSGSGDVLAGIIGGLLARGAAPEQAAAWGVHLHAAAGARLTEALGPLGFLASDLLDVLPSVLPR
jgi:ADP-dependent NAD(P)H-hydrate dehydratase